MQVNNTFNGNPTFSGGNNHFGIGDQILSSNKEFDDLTQKLLEELSKHVGSQEQIDEIKGAVQATAEIATSEKKNKLTLRSMVESVVTATKALTASQTLLATVVSWKDYVVSNFLC